MATTTRLQERNGSTTSQLLQGEDEVRKFVAALVSYTYLTANPYGSGFRNGFLLTVDVT
jgi:hypothetical protein